MNGPRHPRRWWWAGALVLLAAAWIAGYQRDHSSLEQQASAALGGALLEAHSPGVFRAKGGWVGVGRADGWGGPIELLVRVGHDRSIERLELMEHSETAAFLARVERRGFYDQLLGQPVDAPLRVGTDVDTVSSATLSTIGLTEAARQASHAVAAQALGLQPPPAPPARLLLGWQELSVAALFLLASLAAVKGWSRLRWGSRIAGLALLGFLLAGPPSLSMVASLLLGSPPSPAARPLWWLTFLGPFALVLATRKNVYCSWICPFGALQDLQAAITGRTAKLPARIARWGPRLALTGTILALALALYTRTPSTAGYEPFGTLFARIGAGADWLVMPVALLAAFALRRPWCRNACPMGALLQETQRIRRGARSARSPKARTLGTERSARGGRAILPRPWHRVSHPRSSPPSPQRQGWPATEPPRPRPHRPGPTSC